MLTLPAAPESCFRKPTPTLLTSRAVQARMPLEPRHSAAAEPQPVGNGTLLVRERLRPVPLLEPDSSTIPSPSSPLQLQDIPGLPSRELRLLTQPRPPLGAIRC